jgi:hypothetical protein
MRQKTLIGSGHTSAVLRWLKRLASLDWLDLEQAPFYVSIFFAALAWTMVRTVDEFSTRSYIEYSFNPQTTNFVNRTQNTVLGVRLRNLTKNSYDCVLTVIVATRPNQSLSIIDATSSQFVIKGHSSVDAVTKISSGRMTQADFTLKAFHPGGDVEFGLLAHGEGDPFIRLSRANPNDCNDSAGEKVNLPLLVQRSAATVLIANELSTLWLGLALWAIVLVGLSSLRRHRKNRMKGN